MMEAQNRRTTRPPIDTLAPEAAEVVVGRALVVFVAGALE